MKNYIEAEFSCNEYYLIANLLKDSYRIADILGNGRPNLDYIPKEEIPLLLEQFEQFMNLASNIPSIQSLLNFGQNFDRLPSSECGKYNKYMNDRINKIAEAKNDEQFIELESVDVLEAFNQLKETSFYKSILQKTLQHMDALKAFFSQYADLAEEILQPILESLPRKKMEILVIPPELFDKQQALNDQGNTVKSVGSYPSYFDSKTKAVAMIHEIMHTYIPLPPSEQFKNETQREVYYVINHSLVELAANCELGIKICDVDSYFQIPMHDEILKKNWQDKEGIKKEFFVKQGVNFPQEFEFESTTEYEQGGFEKKTETKKDELSNDKIRGIIYPFFLLFKNRQAEEPMQQTMAEIERDSKTIKRIYGEDFYAWISNPQYLSEIQVKIKDVDSIVDLNDSIARDAFGIEKVRTAETTHQFEITDIGRTLFTAKTAVAEAKKMEAQSIVAQDIMQMTQEKTAQEQEN